MSTSNRVPQWLGDLIAVVWFWGSIVAVVLMWILLPVWVAAPGSLVLILSGETVADWLD